MNKPIVKNWMKYWASTLAISGMMVLGACDNEPEAVEEDVIVPEVEVVTRDVQEEEYVEDEAAAGTMTMEEENPEVDAAVVNGNVVVTGDWQSLNYNPNISKLLNEYPMVNAAIATTLTTMTNQPGEYNMPGQEVRYRNYDTDDATLAGNRQIDDLLGPFDYYLDNDAGLTAEEIAFIKEARQAYEARLLRMKGVYIPALKAYYIPSVNATPDVNYHELVEEIKEETILPKELEDAKMQGTVLVQYIVTEKGDIVEATILDGILRQVKEDGTVMSFIRLDERAQAEIREEIVKEDLLEFKGEDRQRVYNALTDESLRVIKENAGEWNPAMQNNEPVRMVMVMPIRFTIDD